MKTENRFFSIMMSEIEEGAQSYQEIKTKIENEVFKIIDTVKKEREALMKELDNSSLYIAHKIDSGLEVHGFLGPFEPLRFALVFKV